MSIVILLTTKLLQNIGNTRSLQKLKKKENFGIQNSIMVIEGSKSISKSQLVLNLRKTCWPSTATGATAPPPAQGSCPPRPASTTASHEASRPPGTSNCPGTASQRAPTFGTWHSSTSPRGDLASATHTIRLQR